MGPGLARGLPGSVARGPHGLTTTLRGHLLCLGAAPGPRTAASDPDHVLTKPSPLPADPGSPLVPGTAETRGDGGRHRRHRYRAAGAAFGDAVARELAEKSFLRLKSGSDAAAEPGKGELGRGGLHDDALKLPQGRFGWDIGNNLFTERAVGRRSRAAGESPSLEGSKTRLDVALGDTMGLGLGDLGGLSQPG